MASQIIATRRQPRTLTLFSWDFLCRIVAGSFFVYLTMTNVLGLVALLRRHDALSNFNFGLTVGSRLLLIAFLSLNCVLFILRWRPISKAEGLVPRVTALAGTFFFTLLAIPRTQPSIAQLIVGSVLLCVGTSFAIIALSKLGRSFSMMAEARQLVTTGLYSVVRHPMYLSEQIAIAGIVIQNFSMYALAMFTIHLWLQIQRMKYEERVLEKTFPNYSDYKKRTARLVPLVY